MSTVLVTGVTGFIGSALCRQLRKEGFDVVGVARKSTNESVVGADLLEPANAAAKLGAIKPDVVIHLAALAHNQKPPSGHTCLSVNTEINRTVLSIFSADNPLFLLASSIAVYGEASRDPIIGLDEVPFPASDYGKSKLHCEEMIRNSHLTDFWLLRFCPVFAPARLDDVAKRVFFPGQNKVRMWMVPAPTYHLCSIDTVVRVLVQKTKSFRQGRKLCHVMDAMPYPQHKIYGWFQGPTVPVLTYGVFPLLMASRLIPGRTGYRIRCDLEKLFRTHLFAEGECTVPVPK
jgi:nucleoside-diphosphate-sugar epimerase